MKRRKVLVIGGNTQNQGAFMMTIAAANAIRAELGAQPVVEGHFSTGAGRAWYGLQPMLGAQRVPFHLRGPRGLTSGKMARVSPWALESEVDAVFDVSGFVFGDQWVDLDLTKRARYFEYWSGRGVPVYLLPQAFGPFEHTAGAGQRVLDAAAMTFARDTKSLEHIRSITDTWDDRVRLAPDFTVLVNAEKPRSAAALSVAGAVPIVPNWNVAKRDGANGSRYLESLQATVGYLTEKGIPFFGLCHEGEGDRKLLEQLAMTQPELRIITGLNGLEAKWLIGQAPFIVAARFHAIVSALSQGVPAVMHGWSHKYSELASDYAASELLVEPSDVAANLTVLARLVEPQSLAGISKRIKGRAEVEKRRAAEMWQAIGADFRLRVDEL